MIHRGSCHCGNIELEFETAIAPRDAIVRACQCGFCRKHGTRAVSDPEGLLTIKVREEARLNRYRFGLETADYLICSTCGVYVAAVTRALEAPRAIAIINVFENHELFSQDTIPMNYDGENETARLERRAEKWMPVVFKETAAS